MICAVVASIGLGFGLGALVLNLRAQSLVRKIRDEYEDAKRDYEDARRHLEDQLKLVRVAQSNAQRNNDTWSPDL